MMKKKRRTNRCCLDLNHHSLAQVLDSIRYDKNDVSHRGAKGLIFMFVEVSAEFLPFWKMKEST